MYLGNLDQKTVILIKTNAQTNAQGVNFLFLTNIQKKKTTGC